MLSNVIFTFTALLISRKFECMNLIKRKYVYNILLYLCFSIVYSLL